MKLKTIKNYILKCDRDCFDNWEFSEKINKYADRYYNKLTKDQIDLLDNIKQVQGTIEFYDFLDMYQ